jgi:hypothetical protein
MVELTTEQYNRLQKFEKHLNTAYHGNYIRDITIIEVKELFEIYNEIYKKTEKNITCYNCRIRIIKMLGSLYYAKKTKTTKRAKTKRNKSDI